MSNLTSNVCPTDYRNTKPQGVSGTRKHLNITSVVEDENDIGNVENDTARSKSKRQRFLEEGEEEEEEEEEEENV